MLRGQHEFLFNSLLSDVSLRETLFSRSSLSFSYRSMMETQYTTSYASWLHRTRSSYPMPRQQISWRTFSPKLIYWTTRSVRPSWTRSTSLLELCYKIINLCIITTGIEGRLLVILVVFVCAVVYVQAIISCLRNCAHIPAFNSSLCYSRFVPDTLGHETWVSEVYILNTWPHLR